MKNELDSAAYRLRVRYLNTLNGCFPSLVEMEEGLKVWLQGEALRLEAEAHKSAIKRKLELEEVKQKLSKLQDDLLKLLKS